MIIQFDQQKAAQGAGPTDHVWKIGLTSQELAVLHSVMQAAQPVMVPLTVGKALVDGLIIGLQAIMEQCRAGKLHPIVTVLPNVTPEPSPDPGGDAPLPVVLIGQGEYAQAWPSESDAPPVAPALVPHPDSNHGGHACYCAKN